MINTAIPKSPTPSQLYDWAKKPHASDSLEDALIEQVKNGGQDHLEQIFRALLRYALSRSDFDITSDDAINNLAALIPSWQDNGRELPYHPLLVRSWLGDNRAKIHYLPPPEAWDGITHYLSNSKDPEVISINETMNCLFTVVSAENRSEIRDATKQIVTDLGFKTIEELANSLCVNNEKSFSSTNNSLRLLQIPAETISRQIISKISALYDKKFGTSDDTRLGLEQLKTAFKRQRSFSHVSKVAPYSGELQQTALLCTQASSLPERQIARIALLDEKKINATLFGKAKITLVDADKLEVSLYPLLQVFEHAPSLKQLALHSHHQKSKQDLDGAKGFGALLKTLRESVFVTQEEFTKQLGFKRSSLDNWENESIPPNSQTPYCPSPGQLERLINGLVTKQNELIDSFKNDFTPLIDDTIITSLRVRWQAVYDKGKRRAETPLPKVSAPTATVVPATKPIAQEDLTSLPEPQAYK